MSAPAQVPRWTESDGVEVWLVAGPGRGRIHDLADGERVAVTRCIHAASAWGGATALLARVVDEAVRRGRTRVWLETEGDDPVGARRFYEALHFRLSVEHLRFRKPAHVT